LTVSIVTVYCHDMNQPTQPQYGIQELARSSGVPRRTIRYYVQLGLIPPPLGAGRGHYYLQSHLDRLLRIRELRQAGRSIGEIQQLLDGRIPSGEPPLPVPAIELVSHIRVTEGVEVVVSHGAAPPTSTQLRALAQAAARILGGGYQ